MSGSDKNTGVPSIYPRILKFVRTGLMLIGLMSLFSRKIEWKSYLYDIVMVYKKYVSIPVKHCIDQLAIFLNIDIESIPYWLPDYIPIALIFSTSLLSAMNHLEEKKNTLTWEDVKANIVDLWKFFWRSPFEFFTTMVLGISVLLLGGIISPIAVIVFPMLFVAFVVLMYYMFFMMIFELIEHAIVPYVIPGIVIGLLLLFLISKDRFYSVRDWGKSSFETQLERWPSTKRKWAVGLRRFFRGLGRESFEQISYLGRLIFIQYRIAIYIGLGFLFILGLNQALS